MSIIQRLREGVKIRFSEKSKSKKSHQKHLKATPNSSSSELYNSNEDLGFC